MGHLAIDINPYHFACDGPLLGIPHFWNVATNLPILAVGILGFLRQRRLRAAGARPSFNWTGIWISTVATGIGSAVYHWCLTPLGLALDRAGICGLIAFVSAHTLDIAFGVGPNRRLSFGLLLACECTVLIWMAGGTAWIYGALQGACGILALGLVLWADSRAVRGIGPLKISVRPFYLFTACYALAKVFEALDGAVCHWTGHIGGHPLKHLLSALGILLLGRLMEDPLPRRARPTPSPRS